MNSMLNVNILFTLITSLQPVYSSIAFGHKQKRKCAWSCYLKIYTYIEREGEREEVTI